MSFDAAIVVNPCNQILPVEAIRNASKSSNQADYHSMGITNDQYKPSFRLISRTPLSSTSLILN
jgi:hypothetical protein